MIGALNVSAKCSAKKLLPEPGIPTIIIKCGLLRFNGFIYDSIANV
jgi:hypothetical protein